MPLACSLAALLAVSATACGKEEGTASSSPNTPQAEIKKKDPVELVFYYPYSLDWPVEVFDQVFAQPIQKKFPHVTVKYLLGGKAGTIQEMITAGQQIDVMLTSVGTIPVQLLNMKLQYDISTLIKSNKYDMNRFDPAMVALGSQIANGGHYGLPVSVPPSAMYYNKDIFDKFGVPYPKDGQTWDDMYETAKKVTRMEGQTQYYGISSTHNHQVFLNQLSIPVSDSKTQKATFDTNAKWKEWTENFVRFYKLPGYEKLAKGTFSSGERNMFFKDKTTAMWLDVTTMHREDELTGMNWEIATFPVFKGTNNGPQPYPTYLLPTATSKNKETAFEVIAYLTSEEFQMEQSKAGKFLTPLTSMKVKEAFSQDQALYRNKNKLALWPKTYSMPAGPISETNNPDLAFELAISIRDMIIDQKDTNTALREAAERVNKKIAEVLAAK
jgi:multiple sugar transport system substrate-binding protein